MTNRRPHAPPSLALLAALLFLVPADAGRGQREVFLETLDVVVVNVEVVVTDAEGHPVRGLTRDDFLVEEDGERVELTNFYAVEDARRRLDQAEREGEESVALPADQRLHLVVLVDSVNIEPGHRRRVLEQVGRRLDDLLRFGDRILVASLAPELRVEQPLTEDVASALAALDRVARSSFHSSRLHQQRRQISNGLAVELTPSGPLETQVIPDTQDLPEYAAGRSLDLIRSWSEQVHASNERLLQVVRGFVGALAGLPGRRAVLYVSQGFDPRPAEGLLEEWFAEFADVARQLATSPTMEANRWDSSRDLRELAREAAGGRVAFYTLDAGGPFSRDRSVEDRLPTSLQSTGGIGAEAGLLELASRTGGAALLGSANVGALLDRLSLDYRDYYSLGFRSSSSDDGRYHRLAVKVPGRQVRVRHTEGYHAKGTRERIIDQTLTALVLDVADNPLRVRVELGKEERESRDRYVLPVLVRVPVSSLILFPHDRVHQGRVSICVAVQDDRGRLSAPQRIEVPVEIPNEGLLQAMTGEVGHGVKLLVRGGESKLAVGVRDELANVNSTLNLSLSVGGAGQESETGRWWQAANGRWRSRGLGAPWSGAAR